MFVELKSMFISKICLEQQAAAFPKYFLIYLLLFCYSDLFFMDWGEGGKLDHSLGC
jgi:hypothetical protein